MQFLKQIKISNNKEEEIKMNAISIGGMFRTGVTIVILILLPLLYIVKLKLESSYERDTSYSRQDDLVPRHNHHVGNHQTFAQEIQGQCRPVAEKIVFLKTHKTASSTVQNVLLRWGRKVRLFCHFSDLA